MFYNETRRDASFSTPVIGSSTGSCTDVNYGCEEFSLHYSGKYNSYNSIKEDEYITKEEKNAMSFVGMIFNRNGIVGFSDSRNSFVLGSTTKEEIIGCPVKKVFAGKKFIFVTHGFNEYRDGIPLEKLLTNVLENFSGNYSEYFSSVYKRLKPVLEEDSKRKYQFLIGYKQEIGFGGEPFSSYKLVECSIGMGGPVFSPIRLNSGVVYAGNISYAPRDIYVSPNLSVSDMERLSTELVSSVIRLGNLFEPGYYSVGGEIQVRNFV